MRPILRTVDEAKQCRFISKTIDYGEKMKGKTRYLCDLWLRKDHWTNTVRVSLTCVKCKKFKPKQPILSLVFIYQPSLAVFS